MSTESKKLIIMYLTELEDNYLFKFETVAAKDYFKNYPGFCELLPLDEYKIKTIESMNKNVKDFFNYLRRLDSSIPIGYEDKIIFENGEFIDKHPMEERLF